MNGLMNAPYHSTGPYGQIFSPETLFLAKMELGTTGPRGLIPRGPSSLIPFLMSFAKRARIVIAFKVICVFFRVMRFMFISVMWVMKHLTLTTNQDQLTFLFTFLASVY